MNNINVFVQIGLEKETLEVLKGLGVKPSPSPAAAPVQEPKQAPAPQEYSHNHIPSLMNDDEPATEPGRSLDPPVAFSDARLRGVKLFTLQTVLRGFGIDSTKKCPESRREELALTFNALMPVK